MKKKNKVKLSLQAVNLIVYGTAMLLILLGIVLIFRASLNGYISKSMKRRINDTVGIAKDAKEQNEPDDVILQKLVQRVTYVYDQSLLIVTDGENGGYAIQTVAFDHANDGETEAFLESVTLGDEPFGEIHLIKNDYGIYEYSVILLEDTGTTAIVFIDLKLYGSVIHSAEKIITSTAILAVVVTLITVFAVSIKLTKSIKLLCKRAERIGSGDFTHEEYDFAVRELYELGNNMNSTSAKLAKFDKYQEQFFQNVSHELRTPLMSIQGYAEGIRYGVFPDSKEAASIIIDESHRLTSMLEQLLYISRVNVNELVMSENDLCDILRQANEKLAGLVVTGDKKVILQIPDEPVYINCEAETVLRAIMNVISNGLRYASTEVVVKLFESGGKAVVTVSDDGPGISDDDLENIFVRFYKGKDGKHGIGLSIAKNIMDIHGGKISAENITVGGEIKGALFTFTFDKIK